MPINSRNKGARGENELFRLLSDELGYIVKRRLDAPREGGADSLDVPGWSIECKRYASATDADITGWWAQAVRQAEAEGRKPVLAYRVDRGTWKFVIRVGDIMNNGSEHWVITSLETWCELVRESMA